MASTHLSRTSSSPTNALKWTYSFWVKINSLSTVDDTFLLDFNTDDNNRSNIGFNGSQQLVVYEKVSGSTSQLFTSNRLFRDPSAWMHIVVSCDRTLSTAGDRTKIYINGVQETSFASQTNPAQNTTGIINTAVSTLIGKYSQNTYYFDGSLTHVHFVDGTAYDASTFGETDSTSGIWKPKTAPSVTYGNNGYFLKMENSGAMGTDSSGNSNTFTVSGTLTQNVDTPDNNFATFNPLFDPSSASISFNNGNLRVDQDTSGWGTGLSSLGVNTGKFYAEFKATSVASNGMTAGIVEEAYPNNLGFVGDTGSIGYHYNGTVYNRGSSSAFGNSYAQGDIIGVAMDLTNSKLYFSKNGVFQNSGDPTSGATGTGAISIGGTSGSIYFLGQSINGSGYHGEANFGQGFFGTTAVTSANADGNGVGKMEYAVPSGYYTLNTKNIKEFG